MNTGQLRTIFTGALAGLVILTSMATAQLPSQLAPEADLPPIVDRHPAVGGVIPATPYFQPPQYYQPPMVPAQQAMFQQPPMMGMGPAPDVALAGWQGPMPGAGCPNCGGSGCPACGWGGDGYATGQFDGYDGQHLGHELGATGSGDCCAPRWFDVHAEWLYWKRDNVSDQVDLTSDGIAGPVVLSTDDLSFDNESGFRVTGAYVVAPSTSLEVSYFGTFTWADSAEVTSDTDNLYSVFSDFGTVPFNGFLETDQANLHRISYATKLNNGELNLRRRWVSANCLLQGSWLAGVRYLRLSEDFVHFTQSDGGVMDYQVVTKNDLIGVQGGVDMFVCLSPRLKIGAEAEAGVYGSHSQQNTDVSCTTCDPSIRESADEDSVAFVGEGGFIGVFQVTPRMKLRGGYQVLFIDGVALAAENFNSTPPFFGRTPFIDDNGSAFYHGANLGFEWTW